MHLCTWFDEYLCMRHVPLFQCRRWWCRFCQMINIEQFHIYTKFLAPFFNFCTPRPFYISAWSILSTPISARKIFTHFVSALLWGIDVKRRRYIMQCSACWHVMYFHGLERVKVADKVWCFNIHVNFHTKLAFRMMVMQLNCKVKNTMWYNHIIKIDN